jgi:MtN3 and saliva related transmembrane protein
MIARATPLLDTLSTSGDVLARLGYVAGVLTVVSFLPQVVRAWRTKQTRDLSLPGFALLITAGSLWMLYGAASGDWPVVATNGGMVLLNVALLAAKVRYR